MEDYASLISKNRKNKEGVKGSDSKRRIDLHAESIG